MRPFMLLIPVSLLALAAAICALWLSATPQTAQGVPQRLPGTDRPAGLPAEPSANLAGEFAAGPGTAEADAGGGEWPRFRGPAGTAICADSEKLSKQAKGLPRVWEIPVGDGYAGPAVLHGRIYLLDYDLQNQCDMLRCLSLQDGREIWRRSYKVDVKRNHGMSRTVPAVTDTHVVSLGPKCHVLCLDAVTGDFKWGKDLLREYGTKVPAWYAGQCPLIDSGKVILAPAGPKVLMTALDLATGKPAWETPNPRQWTMTHVSILPVTIGGEKLYLYCGSGGVAAVRAADGKIVWDTTDWKIGIATVPSPVDLGEGRILLVGGYKAGGMLIDLAAKDGTFTHTVVRRFAEEELGAEQQTPIFHEGYIYAVVPPKGEMVCLDRDGNPQWRSGGGNTFGIGPYILADGSLYSVNDTGVLSVAKATPRKFELQSRAPLLEKAHESWGPLALVGGKLIARDLTRMVCVDLRADAATDHAHEAK